MQHVLNYFSRFFFKENNTKKKSPDIFIDLKQLCNGYADIVFDIGAHHGRYAQKINEIIVTDKCYCFEPYPPSYAILKENLNQEKFLTFSIALSGQKGKADFYSNHFDETNSLLPSVKTNSHIDNLTATKEKIQVEVDTLDSFCDENNIKRIDILKIDTQGNTYNVLNGGRHLLESGSIKIIQCEVEFVEIYKDEPLFHKIANLLEEYGYELYSIYNLYYDINGRLSWGDAIFIKHD